MKETLSLVKLGLRSPKIHLETENLPIFCSSDFSQQETLEFIWPTLRVLVFGYA